jgi:LPXTG-site transpeptidase (sortase) family protein
VNPSNDNTLNIKPLHPTGTPNWGTSGGATNDSIADARQRIASIGELQFNPAAGAPATAAPQAAPLQPAALPVSPAAEQLHGRRKRNYNRAKPILTALAAFLFILALFKAPVLYTQIQYLISSHPAEVQPPTNSSLAEAVPANPLITIPKINVSAPVVYPATTANSPNYDPELENGVVHYPNTALPGQAGNSVLFGHSSNDWWQPGGYKFIFVLLDKLVPGDTFSINYNSKRYIYQVTVSKVVEANDLSVLAPSSSPIVTLITCWPAGTSLKREIIVAKQISPEPSATASTQTAQPGSQPVLPGSAPTFLDQIKAFWQGIADSLANKPSNANDAPTSPSPSGGSTTGSPTLPGAQ